MIQQCLPRARCHVCQKSGQVLATCVFVPGPRSTALTRSAWGPQPPLVRGLVVAAQALGHGVRDSLARRGVARRGVPRLALCVVVLCRARHLCPAAKAPGQAHARAARPRPGHGARYAGREARRGGVTRWDGAGGTVLAGAAAWRWLRRSRTSSGIRCRPPSCPHPPRRRRTPAARGRYLRRVLAENSPHAPPAARAAPGGVAERRSLQLCARASPVATRVRHAGCYDHTHASSPQRSSRQEWSGREPWLPGTCLDYLAHDVARKFVSGIETLARREA